MSNPEIVIERYNDSPEEWDEYVSHHPISTLYHLYGWSTIMEEALGHKGFMLVARRGGEIAGILPLILVQTRLLGSSLISMPFLNYGGACADSEDISLLLYQQAVELAQNKGVDHLEIRNMVQSGSQFSVRTDKATYILPLLETEQETLKQLRKVTRNRLRKSRQYGMSISKGTELVDLFYHGFSIAMKEHGTPVLPKSFFEVVVRQFGNRSCFYIAMKDEDVVGCKLTMRFKKSLYQIWGGYPKKYRPMLGNYLLSWEAVCDAIDDSLDSSDFGRSTIGSGPADFKRYFGCQEHQLYWEYPYLPSGQMPSLNPENKKYMLAISTWKKLPLSLTKLIGPYLARQLP